MKCPNCKNPVNEKDAVCEWCGASLHKQSTAASVVLSNDNEVSLDTELIALLEKGKYSKALKLYITSTGEDKETAKKHIGKLLKDIDRKEFFNKNKYATEEAYQKKLEEKERRNKRFLLRRVKYLYVPIVLFILGLYLGLALVYPSLEEALGSYIYYKEIEYVYFVLGIVLFCVALVPIIFGIKLFRKGIELKRIGDI